MSLLLQFWNLQGVGAFQDRVSIASHNLLNAELPVELVIPGAGGSVHISGRPDGARAAQRFAASVCAPHISSTDVAAGSQ